MCWVRTPVCNRPGQGDFLVEILGNPASLTNLCILTKKCPKLSFISGRAGLFPKVLSCQVMHKFVDTNLLLLKQLQKYLYTNTWSVYPNPYFESAYKTHPAWGTYTSGQNLLPNLIAPPKKHKHLPTPPYHTTIVHCTFWVPITPTKSTHQPPLLKMRSSRTPHTLHTMDSLTSPKPPLPISESLIKNQNQAIQDLTPQVYD